MNLYSEAFARIEGAFDNFARAIEGLLARIRDAFRDRDGRDLRRLEERLADGRFEWDREMREARDSNHAHERGYWVEANTRKPTTRDDIRAPGARPRWAPRQHQSVRGRPGARGVLRRRV